MNVQVTEKSEKKIRQGIPILRKEDIFGSLERVDGDEFVSLVNSKGTKIGTGYLAKENKGIGWVLATQDVEERFLEKIFTLAKERRAFLFQDTSTTAFRLFNGAGDGFGGVAIDWYDGFAVFHMYNSFVYRFQKWLQDSFLLIFPETKGIYLKNRFDREEKIPESEFVYGEEAPEPLLILENGVTYATYLNEGLMTGIFLDQRNVRKKIMEKYSAGKKMLNLFSYTGAFSVASALGGASETTSVDLAKRSVSKTKEQFIQNNLDETKQKIIAMDVFEYFKYAKRKQQCFDFIVLDPPSFARNKKKTFSVAKDYEELIKSSVEILSDTGIIVASTNAANVSKKQFLASIIRGLKEKGVTYQILEMEQLPADFTVHEKLEESDYLKVYFIEVKK